MTKVWIYFLSYSCLFCLTVCAPLPEVSRNAAAVLHEGSGGPECAIKGNSDFYGLGIRIGIYLQWITSFLANHFVPDSIDSHLETNTIFLLALFIATVFATARRTIQSAEIVVLLQLCFGFLFSILSVWGIRTRRRMHEGQKEERIRFPLLGAFFRLTLATAMCAFGLWFWFHGASLHHQHSGCPDFAFLFARVDIANRARVFFQIQFIVFLIGYGLLFVRQFAMIISFYCFMAAWTAIIAVFIVTFGAETNIEVEKEQNFGPSDRATWLRSTGGKNVWKKSFKSLFEVILMLYGVLFDELAKAFKKEAPVLSATKFLKTASNGEAVSLGDTIRAAGKQASRQSSAHFFEFLKQWFYLYSVASWKRGNGNRSIGSNPSHLLFGFVLFLDTWIFIGRTIFQYLCLLVFRKCPPINYPPLIPFPKVQFPKDLSKESRGSLKRSHESNYLRKTAENVKSILLWASFATRFRNCKYSTKLATIDTQFMQATCCVLFGPSLLSSLC